MDLTAMFLHNLRTEPCPGWICSGDDWTDELKSKVDNIFKKFIEYEQSPGFNYWSLITDGKDWVIARRFTWREGTFGGTLEKLESDLSRYYKEA